jgi:hypothetical protein
MQYSKMGEELMFAAAGQPIVVHVPTGRPKVKIPYNQNPCDVLVGFVDAGYLSYRYKSHSQTGYVFTIGNTAISWKSMK